MNVYQDFIQHLRRQSFDEVHILLCDITPKLMEYVRLLTQVKFEDGSYHTFYGEVKKIISSFVMFFNQTMDEVIKEADRCSNEMNKNDLMALIEETVSIHRSNQVEFGNEFLPITSPSEKIIYELIEEKYKDFMKKLHDFREMVEKIQKKDKIEEFMKNNFEVTVRRTSDMFNFTYVFLSMMLADSLHQIRTSLDEILLRMSNNLRRMQDECDDTLNSLLHQLYDKNKESMTVCRSNRRCSIDMAEVSRGIQNIRDKIENLEDEIPLSRLEEEVSYWQERLNDFNKVASNLVKLKLEQENIDKQEKIYTSMKCTELPGSKLQCWETMGETYKKQNTYLKQKLKDDARTMVTFFACRGTDRIFYTNHIGPYYIDEFNHQVYVFDYGLGVYHVNCEGEFKQHIFYLSKIMYETDIHNQVLENEYYFDKHGRYIKQNDEKVYQSAPCTSHYKLAENNLLEPVPVDTVSGESRDLQCRMEVKDPTDVVILPDFDPVDIRGTLDNETVKYLWNTFGSLLPEALHDVGMDKPKNPIHFLAHKLLFHKYTRTFKELRHKKTEAEEYRAKIFKERKEKAMASAKAWKSKQVQRRKPEESDDAQERAVFDAQMAQQAFINSLNHYY